MKLIACIASLSKKESTRTEEVRANHVLRTWSRDLCDERVESRTYGVGEDVGRAPAEDDDVAVVRLAGGVPEARPLRVAQLAPLATDHVQHPRVTCDGWQLEHPRRVAARAPATGGS